MAAAAMKHMGSNFSKLDKFKGMVVMMQPWNKSGRGPSRTMMTMSTEAKYMAEDASSKKFFVSNFTNYKMADSRPVLEQYNELLGILRRFTQHKMNMDESIQVSCIIDKLPPSWKDFKHTLKHLKEELTLVELGGHLRIEESLKMQDSDKPKGNNVVGPSVVNMVEHNNFSSYNDNKGKRKHHDNTKADPNKKSKDDDVAWWVDSGAIVHVCKDRCLFKTYESLNDGSILHMRNESTALDKALDKFKVFKTEVELQQGSQIKRFRTDRGGEYMDTLYFQSVGIIHETTAPYTPQQNGISERKNRVLKEMVNSMLSYSGLSQGFWGEAMLTACYLLNRVPNIRNRAVVRLHDSKLKTLGKRGIECIFVGYVEHSKAFRFYVIEPNDSVSINSIIESKDAIFDENKFSSVPKPSLRIPNETEDIGGSVVPEEVTEEVVQQPEPELRKTKRSRNPKNFGLEFQLYLIEGTKDEKEAINDEMDSIMGNKTWVLADLPPRCKPLGCKWIFKRKLKVDGNIEKFKARLVIQGFKQKLKIDYFDTYAPVARISTIRLLIAMASIHNLIIHQMDVKTAFLNGDLEDEVYMNQPHGSSCLAMKTRSSLSRPRPDAITKSLTSSLDGSRRHCFMPATSSPHSVNNTSSWNWCSARISTIRLMIAMASIHNLVIHQMDVKTTFLYGELEEDVYMNQPQGFIMPSNENKMCKLIKSLYGLKQAPKQWHQKFNKVVLSNGYLLNQAEKYVNLTKEFLSSRFSMKDMGEADVILTLVDTSEKLMPNNGQTISQLEYTSNLGTQHWQSIQRVLKYLKKTMGYRLTYTGYPSVLEGYIDVSWISNTEDNSSTSGWVFLLDGGAISWASKKQTCITGSTMESEFMALAAAGKEAKWLKNLLLEIPLWSKPIAPISIHYDSAATLAKAYSQMYNGKSRHLGVRHSMIRELITNGVISIEFVRSQQNLADHLTKRLARDLVIKSAEGMGLNGLKHMYLHIIPRMCLEPAEKEDEVDLTKDFLSSMFSMKDMGKADVILGLRIKHESNGIIVSQSHYIEKELKKFNYFDCTPVRDAEENGRIREDMELNEENNSKS
ncbi:zinc finger, CCHC-type containing protein [Tanacetum coccineum]